jgi:hypothetical protein
VELRALLQKVKKKAQTSRECGSTLSGNTFA